MTDTTNCCHTCIKDKLSKRSHREHMRPPVEASPLLQLEDSLAELPRPIVSATIALLNMPHSPIYPTCQMFVCFAKTDIMVTPFNAQRKSFHHRRSEWNWALRHKWCHSLVTALDNTIILIRKECPALTTVAAWCSWLMSESNSCFVHAFFCSHSAMRDSRRAKLFVGNGAIMLAVSSSKPT